MRRRARTWRRLSNRASNEFHVSCSDDQLDRVRAVGGGYLTYDIGISTRRRTGEGGERKGKRE